jgi:hypothetical protein
MSWTPPYPTNEMLKLSDAGWSATQIGVRFKVTRNAVIGRVMRARARLAKESAPSAPIGAPPPLKRGEDNAPVALGLVAGNTKDRGAYLDSLVWTRRSYLADLKDEGGI